MPTTAETTYLPSGSTAANAVYSNTQYDVASTEFTGPANAGQTYDDLSPAMKMYYETTALKRGKENTFLHLFGQVIPIPKNKSKTVTARRYLSLAPATSPLTEGVPPAAQTLDFEDVSTSLQQYGGVIKLTDQVDLLHPDPVLRVSAELSGEQASDTKEALHWGVLNAGTNVFYAGGVTSRGAVEATITPADLTKVERSFRRNKARMLTRILGASERVATEPIPASYIAFVHTDAIAVFKAMEGFIPVEKYASGKTVHQNEIGSIGAFRVLASANFNPQIAEGASSETNMSGGTGGAPSTAAKSDVYSCICVGADSYAITPLKGMEAIKMNVYPPGKPTPGNELGQQGFVSWMMFDAAMITNEQWVARIEFAIPA